MKPNKSIDGLVTRSAKTSSTDFLPTKKAKATSVKEKTEKPTKPVKAVKPTKPIKPVEHTSDEDPLEAAILENSLEISVEETEDVAPTKVKENDEPVVTRQEKSAAEDFLAPLQAFDFDDETSEEPDKKTSKKEKKKKNRKEKHEKEGKKHISKVRKIITSIILIIVLAVIGFITWAVLWGNDIIAKITGGQGNILDLLTFTNDTYEPLKTDSKGRTNILAFGTSGYNMEGDEGNGTHAGAQLTDSIMMISLNQDTGDIAMLSLPRDLKASPTCTSTGKINEVYWCNGGGGNASTEKEATAANALMTEVGSILGVEFQYFAHLNWGSLIQIVDILDGITITLDEDIKDYYWTGAVFEAGKEYTINGEQALGLARARHGTSGGDFTRGTSQQKILIGIKNRIFEKHFSIPDLVGLASALGDNLRTNFSINEIKTMAHLTSEFDLESMRQLTLYDPANGIRYMTTGMINGISYVLPSAGVGNYGAIQQYVATNTSNDPRDYENPTILVLNATETPGLASTEKEKLEKEGFKFVDVGDAPEGEYPEGTSLYILSTSKTGSKANLEVTYGVQDNSVDTLPESIPRNYDFIIIINPVEKTDEEDKE